MSFSDDVVKQAWIRAVGHCECRMYTHGHHNVRCFKELVWNNRGREGVGAWEAHHVKTVGDGLSNCKILCWDCHSMTL